MCNAFLQELKEANTFVAQHHRHHKQYHYDASNNKQITKKGGIPSMAISAFILKKLDLQNGDYFQYVEMPDGSVILTPLPKTCNLEKREIDPVSEKAEEKVICGECSGDEDIRKLILMQSKMMDLCQEVMLLMKAEAEDKMKINERVQRLEEMLLS